MLSREANFTFELRDMTGIPVFLYLDTLPVFHPGFRGFSEEARYQLAVFYAACIPKCAALQARTPNRFSVRT